MNTPKPQPIKAPEAEQQAKPRPRRERSEPVRNPAFRQHEGLRALQRELNSKGQRR